jgi:hypothetical protein
MNGTRTEAPARRVVVIGGGRVLADDSVPAVCNMVAIRRVDLTHRRGRATDVGGGWRLPLRPVRNARSGRLDGGPGWGGGIGLST